MLQAAVTANEIRKTFTRRWLFGHLFAITLQQQIKPAVAIVHNNQISPTIVIQIGRQQVAGALVEFINFERPKTIVLSEVGFRGLILLGTRRAAISINKSGKHADNKQHPFAKGSHRARPFMGLKNYVKP
ncbi:hypothetical protein [Symmachiella macrocystis]|uniref:hypothetical protein n=1 Tax=Symmachiella macrocystis TaxID=2527985 RepID=UPI0036F3EBD9